MAYILLVDPNEVAKRAMHGILARGGHRMVSVNSAQEAWTFITEHVRVDLVFMELKLESGAGLTLVQRIRADAFLKILPVVIYTQHADRETVKAALALHVQDVLIKPYQDDAIYTEIAKAEANPWHQRHFEEERSFCKQMGYRPEDLHKMLAALREKLSQTQPHLEQLAAARNFLGARETIATLTTEAETAGAWGLVDHLGQLLRYAELDDWPAFVAKLEGSAFAGRLITRHLDPAFVPEPYLSSQERNAVQEEQTRAHWANAPGEGRCPVVDLEQLHREIDALQGCPVVDSSAASFAMTASGHPSSLNHLMDIVARDSGLAAQMLISASELKRQEDFDPTPLEDPRLAVGRLGEVKLASMGAKLVTFEERHMNMPPHFTWPAFWMFQMAVARIARYTCHYIELYSMEQQARIAGLLQDMGKLILAKLQPQGFQAILAHARENRVPLRATEKMFLGATTHELAVHFAEKRNLSAAYIDVMRWINNPDEATEHKQLVAVVSLARDLCRQNHVGFNGDTQIEEALPIAETAEWRVLREVVFPSFDLGKFEKQVHAECRELKLELQGRLKAPAMA